MKNLLSGLFQRDRFAPPPPKIASCSFYAAYDLGIAYALHGIVAVWPHGPLADHLVDLKDHDALGTHILGRLKLSMDKPDGGKPDHLAQSANFQSQMDQFRKVTGRGPRSFESALSLINITRQADHLLFDLHQQVRGRFAFESHPPADELPRLAAPYIAAEVGKVVANLLKDPK